MEDENDNTSSKDKHFWSGKPVEAKVSLVLVLLVKFGAWQCYTSPASFLPREVVARGGSVTIAGLILTVFEVGVMTTSPIFGGKFVLMIGSKRAFVISQVFFAFSFTSFGLLNSTTGATFVGLAIAIQLLLGAAWAMLQNAAFAIMASHFPRHVTTCVGLISFVAGIGGTTGSLITGVVYEKWGFFAPYVVLGGIQLLWVIPSQLGVKVHHEVDIGQNSDAVAPLLPLLRSPFVLASLFFLFATASCLQALGPTLSIYMATLGVSVGQVAAMSAVMSAAYALLTPVVSWISDVKDTIYPFAIGGAVLTIVGLLVLGKSPILLFNYILTVPLSFVLLLLLGMGQAACVPSSLKVIYYAARRVKQSEGKFVDGQVGGLYYSAFSLGCAAGPMVGSAVMQAASFAWTVTTFAAIVLLAITLLCTCYLFDHRTCCAGASNAASEKEELIETNHPLYAETYVN